MILMLSLLLSLLFSESVLAQECVVRVSGSDQLKFDRSEIKVPKSCKTFEVTVVHSGKMPLKVMGHNWVLAEEPVWREIAIQEAKRFPKSPDDLIKDSRVLAQTSFVGGAAGDPKEAKVSVAVSSLDRSKKYQFFCSFPGHFAIMNGSFILE